MVFGNHPLDRLHVTGEQGFHRLDDLFLDHTAHLEHTRANALKLGVKLLGDVLGHEPTPMNRGVSLARPCYRTMT